MGKLDRIYVAEKHGRITERDPFPRIVIFIVAAEFCERFSYSGMKAFLTLYLRSKLGYTDDGATEIYHIFSTLAYVFPIFGGILADNYLGKFRTILYMMFVYACGNFLVAVTAIPQLALPGRACTLLGLFLVTVGTGGIKPCVTAFGGDQLRPHNRHHLAVYFSVLYFIMHLGNLISKTLCPILRAEVHCFGDKDCYSLAFGAPSFVVLMSIVIFVSARRHYVMKKPEGNVVVDFVKCVALSIKSSFLRRGAGSDDDHSHWLDAAYPRYNKCFIADVKKTLSILALFAVLPPFWALLDQVGSRWTLQATKLDGRLGFITVKPDQMQVLCPVFVLILIPTCQKYIYPWLERRGCLRNPLHKLTLGGALAALAFVAAAALEIYIKPSYPVLPVPGQCQLRVFNGHPCPVFLRHDAYNISHTIPAHSLFLKRDIPVIDTVNITLRLEGSCIQLRDERMLLEENSAVTYYLVDDEVIRYKDNVEKSKSGFPIVRLLVPPEAPAVSLQLKARDTVKHTAIDGVSCAFEMFAGAYEVQAGNVTVDNDVTLESGGVYTIMVIKSGLQYKAKVFVIMEPNSITMALLLPQFFIMSIAEVIFVVTGNEFAFKEAPDSMKAVLTAMWLLAEAMGNVIIIIITRVFAGYTQETQFLIYTGLMLSSISVFAVVARGYRRREEPEAPSSPQYHQVQQDDRPDHP